MPATDSSANLYAQTLSKAEAQELGVNRRYFAVSKHGKINGPDGSFVEFMPADRLSVEIVHDLPPPLGLQCVRYDERLDDFAADVAWARDFIDYPPNPPEHLIPAWHNVSPHNYPFIAVADQKTLNNLRSPDEPGRHLLLDFLGGLARLNQPIRGRFVVFRPNRPLIKKLLIALEGKF
jgi:UDP-3-O-acyl-N-acetylglucosamine deacetylase